MAHVWAGRARSIYTREHGNFEQFFLDQYVSFDSGVCLDSYRNTRLQTWHMFGHEPQQAFTQEDMEILSNFFLKKLKNLVQIKLRVSFVKLLTTPATSQSKFWVHECIPVFVLIKFSLIEKKHILPERF